MCGPDLDQAPRMDRIGRKAYDTLCHAPLLGISLRYLTCVAQCVLESATTPRPRGGAYQAGGEKVTR